MSVIKKYLNDTQTTRLWAKIKAGFVSKSGDTMTGALTLAGDPVSDLQAATKKYVDDNAGGGENIYIAEFDVATASEVENAYEGGKAVYIKYNISTLSYIYPVTSINTNSTSMIIYCVASDGRRLFYINKSTGSWSAGDAYTFAKASSPAFTGTPTAPTAASGTDTTQIATTAFVQDALESVDALPSQTGQSGKFLTTDGTDASWEDGPDISGKLDKSGGTMTGALTLSGAPTNNLHAATKKYVDDYLGDIETILASI